jgi:hypothetical protein
VRYISERLAGATGEDGATVVRIQACKSELFYRDYLEECP